MELSGDQKLQIFCSALTGILSVASTNTILTGDPAAHAFRIANRTIALLEERNFLRDSRSKNEEVENEVGG